MLNIELIAQRQQQEELIKQAEMDRMAMEAIAERREKGYNPALAWLGHRMQTIGTQLIKLSNEDGVYHPEVSKN